MGTRSLTVFVDTWEHEGQQCSEEIVVMYRQMDGGPKWHGSELKEFLKQYRLVNGIGGNPKTKIANGMGCLAAQAIAHFKRNSDTGELSAGGFYLYKAGTRDAGEEYIYTVYPGKKEGTINLKVTCGDVTMFGLPGTKEENMPVLYDGPVTRFFPKAAEKRKKALGKIRNDFLEAQS